MKNTAVLSNAVAALQLDTAHLVAIFALADLELTPEQVQGLLDDPDCPDDVLSMFLDGLILDRRGPPKNPPRKAPQQRMTNNAVLKKLRIAMNLKEDDLLAVLAAGGLSLTNRELTPYFRKPGSKHFKKCPDELLDAVFAGLALNRDDA